MLDDFESCWDDVAPLPDIPLPPSALPGEYSVEPLTDPTPHPLGQSGLSEYARNSALDSLLGPRVLYLAFLDQGGAPR